jgi:hypothetical protein
MKQFIFSFGIERLPPVPCLADPRITRTVEELLKQGELVGRFCLASLCQKISDEPRQALVLFGSLDPGAPGQFVWQGDGNVFHAQ